MEKPSRDFKGIWIPKEIWLSDQLSLMEKILFVEIHSLDNERGCFATNQYFADFFGLHPRRITEAVSWPPSGARNQCIPASHGIDLPEHRHFHLVELGLGLTGCSVAHRLGRTCVKLGTRN